MFMCLIARANAGVFTGNFTFLTNEVASARYLSEETRLASSIITPSASECFFIKRDPLQRCWTDII